MNTFPTSSIIIVCLSSSNPVDLYNRIDFRRAGSTVTRALRLLSIFCAAL